MIYILSGNDSKSKNKYIKELAPTRERIFIPLKELSKELVLSHSNNISLFNEAPIIILENVLSENIVSFSGDELTSLKKSETIFVFKEDKLNVADQKKFKKYAELQNFEEKKIIGKQKFNVFSITDAFASKNKINAWMLYRQSIESGVEAEAVAGILFWKIKTMILNGSRIFKVGELKKFSSEIISLYHKAHRGECDLAIGLEQFILSSLSK